MFRRAFIFLLGAGYFSGCVFLAAPSPSEYVRRKGNIETIKRWTLEQRTHKALVDGESALLYEVANAKNAAAAQKAIDAYLEVLHMFEGWSPDTKFVTSGAPPVTRDIEILFSFNIAACGVGNVPDNRYVRSLFLQLRPDEKQLEWLKMWEKQRDQIKRWLPEATPPGTRP